jgi:hypothetical protein
MDGILYAFVKIKIYNQKKRPKNQQKIVAKTCNTLKNKEMKKNESMKIVK